MNIVRELIDSTALGVRLEARRLVQLPRFEAQIEKLAQKLERPVHEVRKEAESCLREMATLESKSWTWLFDHVMGPAHTRAFTLQVNRADMDMLKQLNKKHALVFLPSHRSYSDPFITTEAFRTHGVNRAHILGGDNLRFFPFEQMAQHSGQVFIRRSLKGADVYKSMLREYLTDLVSRRENLEWYMEGGRSRTGKLRPPMFGLLNYLVYAIRSGAADDVILVPTSITYDQLHEVQAMAEQEASGKKPKEGLSWLIDYARMQNKWIGHAHLRFGQPLSLMERIRDAEEDAAQQRFLVEKTALEVFRRINLATPITTQALATLALLTQGERALTLDQVFQQVSPLLNYLQDRSLPVAQVEALRHHHGVIDTLETLVSTGVVQRFRNGVEPVYRIEPGKHSVAAYYRNSAIHWFINRAILELAMWKAAHSGAKDLVKAGKHETLALRDLLKFEFIFSDRAGFRDELLAESDLFDPNWRDRIATARERIEMIKDAPFLIAPTVLPTFLEAYYIVADRLAAQAPGAPLDQKAFLDECIAVGKQYLLQQRVLHPECLSRELFSNALRLVENRGLLEPGGEDLANKRRAFARECEAHVKSLAELGRVPRPPGARKKPEGIRAAA